MACRCSMADFETPASCQQGGWCVCGARVTGPGCPGKGCCTRMGLDCAAARCTGEAKTTTTNRQVLRERALLNIPVPPSGSTPGKDESCRGMTRRFAARMSIYHEWRSGSMPSPSPCKLPASLASMIRISSRSHYCFRKVDGVDEVAQRIPPRQAARAKALSPQESKNNVLDVSVLPTA